MSSYVLLQRQNLAPRTPLTGSVRDLLPEHKRGGLVAVDLETRGLYAWESSFDVVTVGLADADGCVALDWRTLTDEERRHVLWYLAGSQLVAFNVYFDAAALEALFQRAGCLPHAHFPWVGCAYGLFKQLSTEGWQGQSWSLETAQRDVLGWPDTNKGALTDALKARGLSKGLMWQLPHEVIGPYCAADADAAWQLWTYLTSVAPKEARDYHERLFMPELRLQVEAAFRGIQIDTTELAAARQTLEGDIAKALYAFKTEPTVTAALDTQTQERVATWQAAEPAATTKAGKASVAWQRWAARKPETGDFNFNSKPQLCDLFYNRLGYRATKRTATGKSVIDKKVLPLLGEPGKRLAYYNLLVKRRGYFDRVIERAASGVLRPTFNMVGTVTGRLSGSGGLNLQQMPKDKALMACFRARPGHVLVQLDFAALEPTLLAEFSQDKTLLAIYGPDAKPNQDIYLYIAAKIPALGKEIVKYYDPDNPTAEGLAEAKKKCKRDRGIAKTVHLACIAEGTLVRVRGRGFVPIENVLPGEVVWDGSAWVRQGGALFRGARPCTTHLGEAMTHDHQVLTTSGWQMAEGTDTTQLVRPEQPGAGWGDVWAMAGRLGRLLAGCLRLSRRASSLCGLRTSDHQTL